MDELARQLGLSLPAVIQIMAVIGLSLLFSGIFLWFIAGEEDSPGEKAGCAVWGFGLLICLITLILAIALRGLFFW